MNQHFLKKKLYEIDTIRLRFYSNIGALQYFNVGFILIFHRIYPC